MKWNEFKAGGKLPPERKYVLLQLDDIEELGLPAAVVVGYLRYSAGDRDCPYFVHPGIVARDTPVTHWCDCLGDEFSVPGWGCK
jgi:hypothetical protein